jgi:hypothetical protein
MGTTRGGACLSLNLKKKKKGPKLEMEVYQVVIAENNSF